MNKLWDSYNRGVSLLYLRVLGHMLLTCVCSGNGRTYATSLSRAGTRRLTTSKRGQTCALKLDASCSYGALVRFLSYV